MSTFLQAVGAVVLVVIALVAIVVLASVLYLRYQVKKIAKIAETLGGPVAPISIRLQPNDDAWDDIPDFERLEESFHSNGFERAGQFQVTPMGGVRMAAFASNSLPAYGTITHHPATGTFCEVVQMARDGTTLTVTQATMLAKLRPINKTVVSLPGASIAQLIDEVRGRRLQGELIDHTPERFRQIFEDGYHQDMKFAYEHGDLKGTDPALVAQLIGQDPDDETAEYLASLNLPESDSEDLLREEFLSTSGLGALEWEKIRDHVVFVYDELDVDDVASWVAEYYDGNEEVYEVAESVEGANARDTFRRLITRLDMRKPPELLAHLETPQPCDVYRFP